MADLEDSQQAHFSGTLLPGALPTPAPAPQRGARVPFVIGVAGGTASGKTTVCQKIIENLQDQRVALIAQDSFYRGLNKEEQERASEYNFDHPDAFDTALILETLRAIREGRPACVPTYDFKAHQRGADVREVTQVDVVILEGILVLHDPAIRNLFNVRIFVDTAADVRLARRIVRDTVERGRDVAGVIDQYFKFVKPAFDDFIFPSKKYADIIIPRGGDNHVAVDLIVQHIRTKLGQHDLRKIYPNLNVIPSTYQIQGMHTIIRDCKTTTHDFVFYADRLIRLVVEHGLGLLPFCEKQVVTPTGATYVGVDFCRRLCGVSVVRSGEAMENALRACCKGVKIGKILIHRESGDCGQQLIYEKLPHDIARRQVLLLDPILGTGNTATRAIKLLMKIGVPEVNIIFLTLIAAPEGIHVVAKQFPMLKIITSAIDDYINPSFRVLPGLGEFGDRYFGTDNYGSAIPIVHE